MDTHGSPGSPWVVGFAAVIAAFAQGVPRAACAEVPASSTPVSTCPDPDTVWGLVIRMVPNAAAEFLSSRPRVSVDDLGEEYHVRIALGRATLERTYSDPTRDCGKRARFAAEFVVIALSPPSLTPEEVIPSAAPPVAVGPLPPVSNTEGVHPPTPAKTPPPSPSARRPVPAPNVASTTVVKLTAPAWRFELTATMDAAPSVLRAPDVLSWGANIRVGVGRGPIAGVIGIGYSPSAAFTVGDFRGALSRFPAFLGARARFPRGWLELDGDLGGSVAVERYEGVSPISPNNATRVAVGFEAGIVASVRWVARFAPLVGLRCILYPVGRELATAPEGIIGKTPSIWIGTELGISFEL